MNQTTRNEKVTLTIPMVDPEVVKHLRAEKGEQRTAKLHRVATVEPARARLKNSRGSGEDLTQE